MQNVKLLLACLTLARILAGETPGCSITAKVSVANVAENRTASGISGGWFGDADPTTADLVVAWLSVRGDLPRLTNGLYAIGPGDLERMPWLDEEQLGFLLMSAKILEGNVLETLKDLPACSVQCVVTSPPYYGLRDYGVDGQIGLEPTPEAYVEVLVTLFREIRRVLKDDGTVWLNLGDSYWGGKGSNANLDKGIENRIAEGRTIQRPQTRIQNMKVIPTNGKHESIKAKDLVGIPWMVAFALRNDGWYLRSEIIWAKKNCMPESVKDRPTRSHEQIFLLSKSSKYYYDYKAIMTPTKGNEHDKRARVSRKRFPTDTVNGIRKTGYYPMANARDVWHISVKPYHEAHFATFPPDLIEPCILAGSKEGDIILDPFNGSGTTGEVAIKYHREYIGCEINPEYIRLSERRLSKVQSVLLQERSLTPHAPDVGDSPALNHLSTLEVDSDLENVSASHPTQVM